jgi:hypothetical protein
VAGDPRRNALFCVVSERARTWDPLIKSLVLVALLQGVSCKSSAGIGTFRPRALQAKLSLWPTYQCEVLKVCSDRKNPRPSYLNPRAELRSCPIRI